VRERAIHFIVVRLVKSILQASLLFFMIIADPIFFELPWFILRTLICAAFGWKRLFKQDAETLVRRHLKGLQVIGLGLCPTQGPFVITVNHFTRPGFGAWWLAFSLSACLPIDVKWIATGALTFPGQAIEWILYPASSLFMKCIQQVYGLFLMPPMPPRPQDRFERGVAVRSVLHAARTDPTLVIGLAPEGRDIAGGSLGWPPPGSGRFIYQLNQIGYKIVPVGIFEIPGGLRVRFGAAYDIRASLTLNSKELDDFVSHLVMSRIADLVPDRLQGEFRRTHRVG
jgi:hypothetical protein